MNFDVGAGVREMPAVADEFYEEINEDQMPLYQKYLDGVLAVVDVENNTLWSKSEEYDKERFERDGRLMEKVFREEAASYGLPPVYPQVMITQYFLADAWVREYQQDTYVENVLYNDDEVSF